MDDQDFDYEPSKDLNGLWEDGLWEELDYRAEPGVDRLCLAAAEGDLDEIKKLTGPGRGVNINGRDNRGSTPLHNAIRGGHRDAVRLLQSLGANLEATDGIGYTPLHTSASIRGKESCTKTLLQLGANPNPPLHSRSEEDCSPLHIASAEGNVAAVEALLQHGATILATNGVGDYPLTTAIQWGWHDPVSRGYPIISLLLSHHSSQELKKTEEKAKKEVESATTSLMKLEADTICYQRLLEVIQEEKRRRISKTIKTHSRTGPTTALEL